MSISDTRSILQQCYCSFGNCTGAHSANSLKSRYYFIIVRSQRKAVLSIVVTMGRLAKLVEHKTTALKPTLPDFSACTSPTYCTGKLEVSDQWLNGWNKESGRIKPASDVMLTPATAEDRFVTRRTGLRASRPRVQPEIPPTRSDLSFEMRNKVVKPAGAGATVGRGGEPLTNGRRIMDVCQTIRYAPSMHEN